MGHQLFCIATSGVCTRGNEPIASLATPNQYPASCSVNLRTGELAVGSIESTTLGQGGVTLFKNASGSGTFVQSPDIFYVYFVGYDPSGTLYLDGHDANHDFAFDSYRAATFTAMTVSGGNINQPGNLQYADKSMTIGDQNASSGYSAIYAISVSGPSATITGSTTLTRSIDCVQTFIGGKRVVCPDAVGGITRSSRTPRAVFQRSSSLETSASPPGPSLANSRSHAAERNR